MSETLIEVRTKSENPDYYGDSVRFESDGTLSISGFDGLTRLSPTEARELGEALLRWATDRLGP